MSAPPTLDELKAKVEAAAEKSRKRAAEADEARKLRMLEEKLQLAELEETHGIVGRDIDAVFSPKDGRMVVVKTPRSVTYQKFEHRLTSGKLSDQDVTEFVYACLVYPAKADFEKIIEAAPAVRTHAANAAAKLAGSDKEDVEGK